MAAHITTKVELFVQVRQSLRTVVDKINAAEAPSGLFFEWDT